MTSFGTSVGYAYQQEGYVDADPDGDAGAWWDGGTAATAGYEVPISAGATVTETVTDDDIPRLIDGVRIWLNGGSNTVIDAFGFVDDDGQQVELIAPGTNDEVGTELTFEDARGVRGWYVTATNNDGSERSMFIDEIRPHRLGVPLHDH